jgi:formyltetrahydrofolate hydrolase
LRKLLLNKYYTFDDNQGLILLSDNFEENKEILFFINTQFHFGEKENLKKFCSKLLHDELTEIKKTFKIKFDLNHHTAKQEEIIKIICETEKCLLEKQEIRNLIDFAKIINSNNFKNNKLSLFIPERDFSEKNDLFKRLLILLASNILKYNYLTKNKYFPF